MSNADTQIGELEDHYATDKDFFFFKSLLKIWIIYKLRKRFWSVTAKKKLVPDGFGGRPDEDK